MNEDEKITVDAETILRVVSEITRKDRKSLNLDQSFKTDLGMDSMQALELLVILEEDYKVVIDQSEAPSLKTPRALLDYLQKKK